MGRYYYASEDTAPVTVRFVVDKPSLTPESASRQPVITSGTVPRGLVIFAVPYDTDAHPVLPDEIWTTNIILYLHMSGQPYLSALDEFERTHGLLPYKAIQAIRPEMAIARVQSIDWERYQQVAIHYEAPRQGSTADGLNIHYYSSPTGPLYYRDPTLPYLVVIACSTDQARATPRQYCSYKVRLSDVLMADLSFVDFRFHGGREFVRQRVGTMRALLCSFFACDDPTDSE